jgi:hypothetical protein
MVQEMKLTKTTVLTGRVGLSQMADGRAPSIPTRTKPSSLQRGFER